ncbi:hypothetical protein VVE59_31145, partial [Pseudomonas aeruginosa]
KIHLADDPISDGQTNKNAGHRLQYGYGSDFGRSQRRAEDSGARRHYPGARAALKHTKNFRIGVLGTIGTIKSQAYERALKSINKKVKITALACPKFVPLVESGQYNSPIAKKIVAETLYPIQNCGID